MIKILLRLITLSIFLLSTPTFAFARPVNGIKAPQLAGVRPVSPLVPYWSDGLSLGNFDNSANWQELSGIATANLAGNEAYLWVESDSPANMLAAISRTTGSNQGVWSFQSPPTYIDVEDVDTAVVNGVPYLYFFDFGNNGNGADSRGTGIDMRILRAIEPAITGSNGTISSGNYISIDAKFPAVNGPTLRDAEASFVDPDTGTIYIIVKRDATQRVYSLAHAATYAGTQTLVYEGTMTSLPEARTTALTTTPTYAVDAAISPNGKEILVKNYNNIYYFPRNKTTQTIMQALQQSLVDVPAYVGGGTLITNFVKTSHPSQEPQGEGLCYSKDGRDLYTNSEYVSTEGSSATRYPLFKYTRSLKVPTTVSFQDGVSPTAGYTGTSSTYVWGTNAGTDSSAETTFVVDTTFGNATDDRRGLLKFDLTSIPTSATVTNCRMELWLAAEGQGWLWYRMLVPWTLASTQTSLGGPVLNDGVKAAVAPSLTNGINLDTLVNVFVRDNMLIADCQYFVSNPSLNQGWLGMGLDVSAGGDGVQFDGKVSVTAAHRPKLTVTYTQ